MSCKIKCQNHDLTLIIPQDDVEHARLISDVSQLLSHIQNNPNCVFEEIQQ